MSVDLSDAEAQSIYAFAKDLAVKAGQMILDASSNRFKQTQSSGPLQTKKNSVDLVTETDQAVERFIKKAISSSYPQHQFIGEESFAGGEKADFTEAPTWIVDPIDGTTNFVHGFDHVAVSIGFTYNKKPLIGVVYNPFQKKLYHALKGHGAWLNDDTRLPLSHPSPLPLRSLGEALIAVEWGSDRSGDVIDKKARTYSRLAGDGREVRGGVMAHSLRSIGSAALNYSYVAAGQLDMYWEIGCWAWDVCAGTVLALESGGKVYQRSGKEWTDDALMGHHFFVIRAIGDAPEEKGSEAQERLAKEFFATVEEWDA